MSEVFYDSGDGIRIRLIEPDDVDRVVKIFACTCFPGCSPDDAIKPSTCEFQGLIESQLNLRPKENAILVLEKSGEIIGYLSMDSCYGRILIGHAAIIPKERKKHYGWRLLVTAVTLARSEGFEDVRLQTYVHYRHIYRAGFSTRDYFNYYLAEDNTSRALTDPSNFPAHERLFVNFEESKQLSQQRMNEDMESYSKFLKSGLFDIIANPYSGYL